MSDLATLSKQVADQGKAVEALTKSVTGIVDRLKQTPAPGTQPNQVFGSPYVRTGEDPMSSRGFSFMKMLGLITGACKPEDAKVECDIHDRMTKCYKSDYSWANGSRAGANAFMAPLATSFLQEEYIPRSFRHELKQLTTAGVNGADPDEAMWIRRKMLERQGYGAKDLSWLNEFSGGALVAPPEQGELIELLRNKEALVNAGARTVPLPPQGRLKYPRQTSASTAYWIGENTPITQSEIGTGDITLAAKKLAILIKAPNELIRFASPAAEALMRDDMTKSLALGLDLACLEGQGGDTRPLGIINMQNINTVTSTNTGANGDQVVAQDIYRMIAAVEESNAEFEGWIMRPKTLYKYYQLRWDSVAQGDKSGGFVFNLIREAGDGVKALLGGYPVTKSTQVSQSQAKGNATNLTYVLGGMFSDYLIGMFGAIEFASTTLGDTAFVNDQTWVRAILSADCAARHQSAFVLMNNLDTTL